MLTTETTVANLLVAPTLEALLGQPASRLDAAARLQRMHAAALVECAINGHAGLTIAAVARRAKVSTASIYASYKDRDALLVASMQTLFAILASDVIEVPDEPDPQKRVEKLLIAHGEVYAQPLWPWVFRLHSVLVWSGHSQLRDVGHAIFQGIDSFWGGFLGKLVAEGHLVGCDPAKVVPYLLGPMERCTIIAQLGGGEAHANRPPIAEVARHSAEALFRLWGTAASAPINHKPMPVAAGALTPPSALPLAVRLAHDIEREKSPRTPKAARDRVLLAAAAVCQDLGYHDANMREVAKRAKVSTATVYKLYADKADLFATALEAEFGLHVALDDIQLNDGEPQAVLIQALRIIAERACDPQWMWMLHMIMASEISTSPRMVSLWVEHRTAVEAFLQPVLASVIEQHAPSWSQDTKLVELALNAVLGPLERSGLLTLMLFGKDAIESVQLTSMAEMITADLIRLLKDIELLSYRDRDGVALQKIA